MVPTVMENPGKVCLKRAKSTDRNKLIASQGFHYSDFVTDFVTVILSQSEGLGKMALGIVKIYLRLHFSANRRCSWSVCHGQLSWTLFEKSWQIDKNLIVTVKLKNNSKF